MKTDRTRKLLEASKPQMIADIEKAFGMGERIWDDKPNFALSKDSPETMFGIANKYIFENRLNQFEPKEIVDESVSPDYKKVMAVFSSGCVAGQPHKLILVKHAEVSNFFNAFCAVVHEMIHLYDHEFGPMGKMLRDNLLVGQLDWGPGYHSDVAQALDATEFPRMEKPGEMPYSGPRLKLRRDQLPDDMPAAMAKQYQFPWFRHPAFVEMFKHGLLHPGMLPAKYVLSDVSMYDVHGRYFKLLADRANYVGFDVSEVFDASRPHRLRKVWESRAEGEMNPAEVVVSRIITDEHIQFEFRSSRDWIVEMS